MILNFDPQRMVPTVFYHYPTCVVDRIAEFKYFDEVYQNESIKKG